MKIKTKQGQTKQKQNRVKSFHTTSFINFDYSRTSAEHQGLVLHFAQVAQDKPLVKFWSVGLRLDSYVEENEKSERA